jgi:hypothetical protein
VFIVRDGAPIGVVSQGSLLRWYSNLVAPDASGAATASPQPADSASRERLLEAARAVSQCAAQLSKNATGAADDPLAPVLEAARKLQNLVDVLAASAQGKKLVLSLTDSDSFPAAALSGKPPAPTG